MLPFTVSTRTASFRLPELSEDRIAVHHVPGGVVLLSQMAPAGSREADRLQTSCSGS